MTDFDAIRDAHDETDYAISRLMGLCQATVELLDEFPGADPQHPKACAPAPPQKPR